MTDSTETDSAKSYTATNNDGTTYCVQEDESVTDAVVRAVSAEKEHHPTEIESLYSVVETDALNTLFAPQMSGDQRMASGAVVFKFSGCDIRVTHDGEVLIEESGMYQFDCNYCDVLVEEETVEQVKGDAQTHLKENHAEDVITNLKEQYTNVPCQNECGYTVPIGVETVAGIECPECGYDDFSPLLEQYIFFRITENT